MDISSRVAESQSLPLHVHEHLVNDATPPTHTLDKLNGHLPPESAPIAHHPTLVDRLQILVRNQVRFPAFFIS